MATTIKLRKEKDCKNSVRYRAEGDAVIDNVYLAKSFGNPMPNEITITVSGERTSAGGKSKKSKEVPSGGEGE